MASPTLRCPCQGEFCATAIEYRRPPVGETSFPAASGPYRRAYDACGVCGHYFGRHDLDVRTLYEGQYVAATYGSIGKMREKFQAIASYPPGASDNYWRVKRVDERWRRQGHAAAEGADRPRLLDVGTGLAVFPSGMRGAGWDCTVVDPDPQAIAHARDDQGLTALCGDFLDLPADALGRYDMVTFNKVLEHVEDPVPLLAKAGQLTREHGLLYVEVPDVEARHDPLGFDREEFFIEHLHVFSAESLCRLVANAGLRIIDLQRLREPSGKYTLTAFASRP